jgi:hypothetical protein
LIKTGNQLFVNPNYHSPIRLSYEVHHNGPRQSWDPIAVYYSIMGKRNLFNLSENGHVTVEENGKTVFTKDVHGKHNYIESLVSDDDVIEALDQLII